MDAARGPERGRVVPWATLGLAAAALAVAAVPGAGEVLALDLRAARAGELWRLVTGHLVHGSPALLALDVAALLVLGLLLETRRPRLFRGPCLASAVATSLALLLLRPDLARYEGSSALSSAALVALAVSLARTGPPRTRALALVALAAFALKTALEAAGAAPASGLHAAAGVEVSALAHAVGGAVGLAGAWWPADAARGARGGRHPAVRDGIEATG